MKKGFTLIEILASIIILGIIMLITYSVVTNVISVIKDKSFLESKNGLIRAARLYMEANQELLPYNNGDITEVSIATLISEKYINPIKSPVDGSTCGGYILVRQNVDGEHDYAPVYRCGASSGVTSRATDALALDYTFDDFQEPTTNIVPNSPINSYPRIGNTHGTYNTNQYNNNVYFSIGTIGSISGNVVTLSTVGMPIYTYDVLTPQTTGGGVTAGTRYYIKKLSSTTFTLHAYDSSQDGSKGFGVHDSINNDQRVNINATGFPTMWHGPAHVPNSALVKEIIPNCFTSVGSTNHECIRLHTSHKPDGAQDGMAYSVNPTVVAGNTYTFSFYYRAVDQQSVGKSIHLTLWTTTSWANMGAARILSKNWQRYEITAVAPASGATNFYFWPSKGANIDISEIQVEEKKYATEFTTGVRTGSVTDYSGNSINSSLTASSSPKWVYDTERKGGTYQFTNNTITFGTGNTFFPLNTFTMMAWIKTPGLGSGMTINGIVSITYGLTFYLDGSGNLNFRMDDGASIPAISVSKNLHDNKYHHVVVQFDGTNRYMYIDGELMRTSTFVGWTGTTRWPTNTAVIGQENNNGPFYRFNGSIDNFKIFRRVLAADEIKSLYYMERVN